MTSNVTLQTAQQLSGLMVSRAVHKRCSSRPLKQKATKCHASAPCQRLATYAADLKRKKNLVYLFLYICDTEAYMTLEHFFYLEPL